MTTTRTLFAGHLMALAFGLGGLLIALPHPELWAGSRFAAQVFGFGMNYAGSLHIILGAATMLAFGLVFLGLRRTLIFFVVTVSFSLSAELIGTGTGWPFGNYAYTDGLGFKVLGRVPFTIPLSWFSIGFSAFLLGSVLATTRFRRHRAFWSVAIGAYLLTVWDLVLDPAMAHPSMPIRFWTWFETGPYFGMPVQNFAGWTLTGILFMAASRALWRKDVSATEFPAWVPFGVYLANMVFAVALSLSVGLWQPTVAAVIFGCLPALLAWRSQPTLGLPGVNPRRHPAAGRRTVIQSVMQAGARFITARQLEVEVVGESNLPATGPVVIVSRHYHHLYDGAALLGRSRRHLHVLVALDWAENRLLRRFMESLCRLAGWPVILRADARGDRAARSSRRLGGRRRYLRRAVGESADLLRRGEVMVVYPEGYPTIDPTFTPKQGTDEFLPFRPGFLHLVERARRDGYRVPIVPLGLAYQEGARTRLTMRFGSPIVLRDRSERDQVLKEVEQAVRALSEPPVEFETTLVQEVIHP